MLHTSTPALAPTKLGLIAGDDYTMSAWLKLERLPSAAPPDAMVFGQPSGDVLLLGVRGDQFHFGHWMDDSNSGELTLQADQWYHVSWRYSGDRQAIFVDGIKVGEALGVPLVQDGNILVGTSLFAGDRDFEGWIDEVHIAARGFDDEEIFTLYQKGLCGDIDNDGIGDVFEANNGLDPDSASDALIDHDRDGIPTLIEVYSGSDHTDPQSTSALVAWLDGEDFVVEHRESIAGAATAVGTIEWSDDSAVWQAGGQSLEVGESDGIRIIESRMPISAGATMQARLRVETDGL